MVARAEIENIIKRDISNHITNNHLRCTICNSRINISDNKIGLYLSDVDICRKERKDMTIDVIFCSNCNPEHIRLPHLGINELNITITLNNIKDKITIKSYKINHKSDSKNGIVWTPCRVWKKITGESLNNIENDSSSYVSELLYQSGIPIVDIIMDDGKINFQDYSIQNLRDKYHYYIKNNK